MIRTRKILRHKYLDYSNNRKYFITICTKYRINHFGEIKNNKMFYSDIGLIAREYLETIPRHFIFCEIDSFVVMPNHVHMVVVLNEYVGVAHGRPNDFGMTNNRDADRRPLQLQNPMNVSIPKIINHYKGSVTRIVQNEFNNFDFQWQRSYHDHIIRNDHELNRIQIYINHNILNWNKDINNK
ncbi:MAG: transposase [Candidatus Dojkabacteria bacterium]